MWRTAVSITALICLLSGTAAFADASADQEKDVRRVPLIYSSDLFHPHDDPDDHFDLATLFAIPEFNILAVVLDLGDRQVARPGAVPLKQMMHMTKRSVPYGIGLARKLRSPDDKATDQPEQFQAGVLLILKALRESKEPVTIFQTGSLRDIAAAFNRDPALFREKVARLYVNAGHAGGEKEWNVDLDPHAYVRVLRSGLPIYWVPCFGPQGYGSLWKFRHDQVLQTASPQLQSFFIYALAKVPPSRLDPIAALGGGLEPSAKTAMWTLDRNMWCTAAFLHAAGKEAARSPDGRWHVTPIGTRPATSAPSSRIASFEKRQVRLDPDGKTRFDDEKGDLGLPVFRRGDERTYNEAMTAALENLLKNLGR